MINIDNLTLHPEYLLAISPPPWSTLTTRSSLYITLLHPIRHLSVSVILSNSPPRTHASIRIYTFKAEMRNSTGKERKGMTHLPPFPSSFTLSNCGHIPFIVISNISHMSDKKVLLR
jgi:hypothetical protein